MGTNRLAIYNGALLHCGVRSIASLTVNEEARRVLDEVWNDGGVRYCLEQGQWRFAMRTVRIDPDPAITPDFGYRLAFGKPSDWVDTSAVCADESFRAPLLEYTDEVGYWFADVQPLYVKYVSDDGAFGNNLVAWPYSFTEFVKAHFASRIVTKLTDSEVIAKKLLGPNLDGRSGMVESMKLTAKNRDAMAEPSKRPAPGAWIRSRWGRGGGGGRFGDGGSSGSLIG